MVLTNLFTTMHYDKLLVYGGDHAVPTNTLSGNLTGAWFDANLSTAQRLANKDHVYTPATGPEMYVRFQSDSIH
eukprot:SAG11_NODE_21442_length_425_cov_0.628834_2_plen_73_part_01